MAKKSLPNSSKGLRSGTKVNHKKLAKTRIQSAQRGKTKVGG